MKLYPPAIEGKIPAFAGTTIQIPFGINRAVNMAQVDYMKLRIKSAKTNQVLSVTQPRLDENGEIEYDKNTGNIINEVISEFTGYVKYDEVSGNYSAIFDLKDQIEKYGLKIEMGQFYKVQIAFTDKYSYPKAHEIGYYSSVGIVKRSAYPTLEIPSLLNNYYGNYEYIGVYRQALLEEGGDPTEKVYSYCFDLKDVHGNVVSTSGTQIHNTQTDTKTNESQDTWSLRKNLQEDVPYYLSYKVTTMNGLECESQSYIVISRDTVDSDLQQMCDLIATPDYEDGFIELALRPKVKSGIINGSFILARSSSEDNFDSWNELYRFEYKNLHVYGDIGELDNLLTVHPDFWDRNDLILWKDFSVQQGVEYVYSIQAYNSRGLYSNRLLNKHWELDLLDNDSVYKNGEWIYKEPDGYDEHLRGYYFKSVEKSVVADFEDMFLFDGERQLKIRFNPKVTSFKTNILESKVDTLGGKYPFVFRNGNVYYKEFPVSGLISLISDPHEYFLKGIQTKKLLYRSEATGHEEILPGDTHVTMDNIRRERQFKMETLDWLNNGKPKLFRSPGEGNFIVRIMNVSMSPLDVVSRMLHTFSGTAYEIADHTFDNLNKYGFISNPERDNRKMKIGQIELARPSGNFELAMGSNNTIKTPAIYQANFTNVRPGSIIAINFADGYGNIEVEIGTTGAYYVLTDDKAISSISLIRSGNEGVIKREIGTIYPDISKWEDAILTFGYYDTTPTDNFSQISGLEITDEFRQFIGISHSTNIMELLEDFRRETSRFHYIRVLEREQVEIYKVNGKWSWNETGNDLIEDLDWSEAVIYYHNTGSTDNPVYTYYYGKPDGIGSPNPPSYKFTMKTPESEAGEGEIDMNGRQIPKGRVDDYMPVDSGRDLDVAGEKESGWIPQLYGRIDAITGVDKIVELRGDTGLIVEVAYRVKLKEYAVEEDNPQIVQAKREWKQNIAYWESVIANPKATRNQIAGALHLIEQSYFVYVRLLEEKVREVLQ